MASDQDPRPNGVGPAPAFALMLLAPIVAEVLYGATRVSTIFVLVPEVAAWGCGALLIREAALRRRLGWVGLLMLGAALAVAEECLIQQTSLAPMPWLAAPDYGRVLGVNWVYFLWAVGYEAVWVVVLPVRLTELIFPGRRDAPWVGRRGLILSGVAFVVGSFVAWYSWTQVARVRVFHLPEYRPTAAQVFAAIAAIGLLAAVAFGPWAASRTAGAASGRPAPGPGRAGAAAFLLGAPWCALALLGYGAAPSVPFPVPLIAGLAWAVATLALMALWTSRPGWGDRQRFAVVSGGIAACMAGGVVIFAVGGALAIDWIGKALLDAIALLGLARLGRRRASEGGWTASGTPLAAMADPPDTGD